jgi:hypothetical protein
MLEATVVTGVAMRAFGITTDPAPVPLFTGITLRPAGAMPATVTPR